jgi:hypothetical protein
MSDYHVMQEAWHALATGMRGYFATLVEEGFTQEQALALVVACQSVLLMRGGGGPKAT